MTHAEALPKPAEKLARAAAHRGRSRRERIGAGGVVRGLLLLSMVAIPSCGQAQETADFFRQNCTSCHTIGGGRLVGPDLKDVTQRRDRAWLSQFLNNPKAVIDSGDSYAASLQQDANGVIMPTIPGMSPQRAQALLDMITAESQLPRSQFAGSQVSDRPFTPADVANGRAIFLGGARLQAGGPACVSCHTVRGIGGLSGGRLGPDLTLVYERLQGRKALTAWLGAPATPTMQSVFKMQPLQPAEILALAGFLEDAAKKGGTEDTGGMVTFFLLGLGGAGIGLVIFEAVWKRRFRSVRRAMVRGAGA